MSENVLEVAHLSVRLGATSVLRDLSFSVPTGALMAIIGPNGSGKTVLFRALIGAIEHDGVIRWAPDARVGYVPQKLDLERNLPVTAEDILGAKAHLARRSSAAVRQVAVSVGLGPEVFATPIAALSGGQLQRVLLAVALLGDPTVLLLDEPTAGVDQPGQERMKDLLRRLVDDGVTILMISHELSVILRSATTVLCLTHDHRCFGVPRDAVTPELLNQIYGEPVGLFLHEPDGR